MENTETGVPTETGSQGQTEQTPQTETQDILTKVPDDIKADLLKYIQSSEDKRVQQALRTYETKRAEDTQKQIDAAKKSEAEKRLIEKGEAQKIKDLLQAEIDSRDARLASIELERATLKALGENNLSEYAELYSFDNNSVEGRIRTANWIKEKINNSVANGVKTSLGTPRLPQNTSKPQPLSALSPQELSKLSKEERLERLNAAKSALPDSW